MSFLGKDIMKGVIKEIKKATGLTLDQFCQQHLKCQKNAFSTRLRKNSLYPNEYIYISLITNKPLKQLFGHSFDDIFLFKGDPEVTTILKYAIAKTHSKETLNRLLSPELTLHLTNGVQPIQEAQVVDAPLVQSTQAHVQPEPEDDEPFEFKPINLEL